VSNIVYSYGCSIDHIVRCVFVLVPRNRVLRSSRHLV